MRSTVSSLVILFAVATASADDASARARAAWAISLASGNQVSGVERDKIMDESDRFEEWKERTVAAGERGLIAIGGTYADWKSRYPVRSIFMLTDTEFNREWFKLERIPGAIETRVMSVKVNSPPWFLSTHDERRMFVERRVYIDDKPAAGPAAMEPRVFQPPPVIYQPAPASATYRDLARPAATYQPLSIPQPSTNYSAFPEIRNYQPMRSFAPTFGGVGSAAGNC